MCAQRLELRAEEQRRSAPPVVERLLSHAIARQMQLRANCIPQSEGEHARELLKARRDPPRLERGQHYLGVGAASKGRATRQQIAPNIAIVVDLAVENDDE